MRTNRYFGIRVHSGAGIRRRNVVVMPLIRFMVAMILRAKLHTCICLRICLRIIHPHRTNGFCLVISSGFWLNRIPHTLFFFIIVIVHSYQPSPLDEAGVKSRFYTSLVKRTQLIWIRDNKKSETRSKPLIHDNFLLALVITPHINMWCIHLPMPLPELYNIDKSVKVHMHLVLVANL